jgi:hypothetical protein
MSVSTPVTIDRIGRTLVLASSMQLPHAAGFVRTPEQIEEVAMSGAREDRSLAAPGTARASGRG